MILLDGCELDRSDLEVLIDSAPGATFVLASNARTLWHAGSAIALRGLDAAAGVRLFERSLGRQLQGDERTDAERLSIELERAVVSTSPDPGLARPALRWFRDNLPHVAATAVSVLVNPLVRKVVDAAGTAVADQFREAAEGR